MSSTIVTTLQAAALSALSNILAQTFQASQSQKQFSFNFVQLIQFVIWSIISTPPNIYWQDFLEEQFPSTKVDEKGQKKLSKINTVKKFVLDQTISGTANNAAFIAGMATLQGRSFDEALAAVRTDFWPVMVSSWKVWPLASLLSFTVIPAKRRIIFGSFVGLIWGIYLSLLASHQST